MGKFRAWFFDLMVAIGQIDKGLAAELGRLVKLEGLDKWKPEEDGDLDKELYDKYTGELYGVLCSVTQGEPKNIVRGIVDAYSMQDGFRALAALNHRYDQRTTATLLQASLEVVGPPSLKGVQEVLVGVPRWEAKVASLFNRHNEKISDQMKLAIFINMLPKEYQDVGMQMSCGQKLNYTELRDHILGMANQKAQMNRPVPMDTNSIDAKTGEEESTWEQDQWYDGWGVDAVSMNTQCFACWGYGHLARDCPLDRNKTGKGEKGDKGKGKGKAGSYGKGVKGKGKGKQGFKGKGEKGKSKGKGDGWGPYYQGKGYQGYCYDCGEQGHKANEGMCKVQNVDTGAEQNVEADCGAVVIDSVWKVCQVEEVGNQLAYKPSGSGIRLSNQFADLTEEDEEEEDEDEGETGPIHKEKAVDKATPSSRSREPTDEKYRTGGPGLPPIAAEHWCEGGGCCEGFQDARSLRRRQRRQWKKMTDFDVDFDVCPVEKEEGKMMCLDFQVADVKKPLIAVKRITEKGNHVTFGPDVEDNYIWNKSTGDKMMLKPQGKGSYVMDVQFVGGEKTVITVDSGAEESVCPWDWGERLFGTSAAENWMTFKNASGGNIPHWGKRKVKVISPF